jgi:transposase/predicted transcriptional regulator
MMQDKDSKLLWEAFLLEMPRVGRRMNRPKFDSDEERVARQMIIDGKSLAHVAQSLDVGTSALNNPGGWFDKWEEEAQALPEFGPDWKYPRTRPIPKARPLKYPYNGDMHNKVKELMQSKDKSNEEVAAAVGMALGNLTNWLKVWNKEALDRDDDPIVGVRGGSRALGYAKTTGNTDEYLKTVYYLSQVLNYTGDEIAKLLGVSSAAMSRDIINAKDVAKIREGWIASLSPPNPPPAGVTALGELPASRYNKKIKKVITALVLLNRGVRQKDVIPLVGISLGTILKYKDDPKVRAEVDRLTKYYKQ